jgi:putative tryptophan/tyrosine transport system substrate-binding protein
MRRRNFIAGLASTTAAWPLAARAQPPVIGYLGSSTPATQGQWLAAFVQRLHELGWIEGRNVAVETRWASGDAAHATQIVAEFLQLKAAVIVTTGTPMTAVAKQATSAIPIVFISAAAPVNTGFVSSLARPGGNITGLSNQSEDTPGKRLGLLQEVIPSLRRLAVFGNAANPVAVLEMNEVVATAQKLGLDVVRPEIHRPEDFAPAFAVIKGRADALYVQTDFLTLTNRTRIITLALEARLPTMHLIREFVEAGGLMSYGPNVPDLCRRAGDYVDKILRGTKPGDIPVEQPTKFDLVINLTTAKALGITVPQTLLATAAEVIE